MEIIEVRKEKNRNRNIVRKVCDTCSIEFTSYNGCKTCRNCYRHNRKVKCSGFLGYECSRLIVPESSMCLNCFNSSRAGENSPTWKGGKTTSRGGYTYIIVNGYHPRHNRNNKHTGYVAEHTLVMEEHIGRFLVKGETVHHLNGIRDDNRIENLELWCKPPKSGIRNEDAITWAIEVLNRNGYKVEIIPSVF